MRFVFLFLGFLLSLHVAFAQVAWRGQVISQLTNRPCPFAYILLEGKLIALADAKGRFQADLPQQINWVSVTAAGHRAVTLYSIPSDSIIRLLPIPDDEPSWQQSQYAAGCMQTLFQELPRLDPERRGQFQLQTYSKLTLHTDSLADFEAAVKKVGGYLTKRPLPKVLPQQHILLLERLSDLKYWNQLDQKEQVLANKVSGLPGMISALPLHNLQSFSCYVRQLKINNLAYCSPLYPAHEVRYNYYVVDARPWDGDTLIAIRFRPKKQFLIESVTGTIYYLKNAKAVKGFECHPSVDNWLNVSLIQQMRLIHSQWFPDFTVAYMQYDQVLETPMVVNGTLETYFQNQSVLTREPTFRFPEVIKNMVVPKTVDNEAVLAANRPIVLSKSDENTYAYYDALVQEPDIQRWLGVGESLYHFQLPLGKTVLRLDRLLNFNLYENARVGVGALFYPEPSKRLEVEGFYGFGIRDADWKGELTGRFYLAKQRPFFFYGTLLKDIEEPGNFAFKVDKRMYVEEALRQWQAPLVDQVNRQSIGFEGQISRWMHAAGFGAIEQRNTKYGSVPKQGESSLATTIWQHTYVGGTLRFSYGEGYMTLIKRRYSLSTPYPEFWLQWQQGTASAEGTSFSYTKLMGKMQYKRQWPMWGITGIQVVAGQLSNPDVPLSFMFNGLASYRETSAVTFNSFETMRYNSYAADRFAAVFISHSFPRVYIPGYPFYPYLVVMNNVGWGQLSNPGVLTSLPVKGYEKGYSEAGAFINELYNFKLGPATLGFGLGLFYRYGTYAQDSFSQNAVYKFAISIML